MEIATPHVPAPDLTPEAQSELADWCASLVGGRTPGTLQAGPPQSVIDLVGRRGLAGMAWAALRRGDASAAPVIARSFESAHAFETVRGGEAVEMARQLRLTLTEAGVPSLLLKGAALIEQGVWTAGERRLGDLDLLVSPRQAERAVTVLVDAGLLPWAPWVEGRSTWYSAFSLDLPARSDELQVPVDLHWSSRYSGLRYRPSEEPDPMWVGADVDEGLPTHAAHFAMTADHVLKHLRVTTHLAGFADLVRLLPRLDDPEAVLDHVRRRGITGRVQRLMNVLEQSFGVGREAFDHLPPSLRPTGAPVPTVLGTERLLLDDAVADARGAGLRLRWAMGAPPGRDLLDALWPDPTWLRARYPDLPSTLSRRREHLARTVSWLRGRGMSPLSPNQEFVGEGVGAMEHDDDAGRDPRRGRQPDSRPS